MADIVLLYPHVTIDAVDYSAAVQEVGIDYGAELQDNTAGQTTVANQPTRVNIGGLKTWSMEFKIKQDFADNQWDELLFNMVGVAKNLVVRPDKAAVIGLSNPEYRGSGILASYPPLGQAIGEHVTTTITFEAAGTLTRVTA